jgi:anti-anti-sigma regulatory factor
LRLSTATQCEAVFEPMLKITAHTQGSTTTLELEGRLAGPWVAELRDSWHRAVAASQAVGLVLNQVTFIDGAGEKLLGEICRSGAEVVGEGCMTRATIERIKRGGK